MENPVLDPEEEKDRKEFNISFASLQSWFIRIRHNEKLKFILKLLEIFVRASNTNVLIDVMDPITKDLIYAKTQFTHTKHDITPLDHNRCLTTVPLAEAISTSLSWFSELQEKEQIYVMIILLKLSGSSIMLHFYIKAVKYIDYNDNNLDDIKEDMIKYSFVHSILNPDSDSVKSEKSYGSKKVSPVKTKRGVNKSPTSPHNAETKLLLATAKNMKEWEKQFSLLLDESQLFKEKISHFKSNVIDMIQLLPISVNRSIYSRMDFKARRNLNSISKYWIKSSGDIQKELNTRYWLKENLKEWKNKLLTYKAHSFGLSGVGKYHGKKSVLGKIDKHSGDTYFENGGNENESVLIPHRGFSKHETNEKIEPVDRDVARRSTRRLRVEGCDKKSCIKIIPLPDNKHPEMYHDPYKGKFIVSDVSRSFDHTRCMAVNAKWIAVSDGYNITLHSLLTGAPNPCQLVGHTGDVTALCFHPSKNCLFSGSSDFTMKYWDIYSRIIIATYSGHKKIISDISANETYLASVSIDKTLRIFKIENCLEIWVAEFFGSPTALTLGNELQVYFGMLDGAVFKVDIKYEKKYEQAKEEIILAHNGKVTCIIFVTPFLVTGSTDGFVHVWHYEHIDARALATLDHKGRYISSVALSYMKVLTTADDGKLRIWDIYNSTLKREIVVNLLRKPILSMKCLELHDHTKVIINNEDGLKSIEFAYDWVKLKKMCILKNRKEPRYIRGLTRIISSKPEEVLSTFQYKKIPKEPNDYKCKHNLFLRNAALSSIVRADKGDIVSLKEVSVISKAALTKHNLLLFPRIIRPISSYKGTITVKKTKKESGGDGTSIKQALWQYFPRSKKGILPGCNPSKRTI